MRPGGRPLVASSAALIKDRRWFVAAGLAQSPDRLPAGQVDLKCAGHLQAEGPRLCHEIGDVPGK